MTNSLSFEDLCQAGREHLKAGRLSEAVAAFEEARLINDLDADVHDGLATAHYLLKDDAAAARHFERVTRLDPRRGPAWINLGAVYNRMREYQKAADVLRRAVQIEKKSAVAFYNLGFACKHLKQWNMAVPAYREAIRLDPKMADAYYNLGNVFSALNNQAQAVSHYKRALQLDPNLERARRKLEEAETALNASRTISPFGRLVDNAEPAGAAQNPAGRELDEHEREEDRRKLHELLKQLDADLDLLLASLGEKLDPAVRTLNKMLTQHLDPHSVSITKADALENFREARAEYAPRLRQIQETLGRLRDHEARMS